MNGWSLDVVCSKNLLKNMHGVGLLSVIPLGILVMLISAFPAYAETGSVTYDGTTYDVEYDVIYDMDEVIVAGFEVDPDYKSLIIYVDAPSSGSLNVTLERSFIDSVSDDVDAEFLVLVDGDSAVFEETETTTEYRVLRIDVPEGADDIEIIGSEIGSASDATVGISPADISSAEVSGQIDVDTMCGPGTILQDDVCILESDEPVEANPVIDTMCGPGTILQDDVCIVPDIDSESSADSTTKMSGSGLVFGTVGAFIVAGAIGGILGLIYKAGQRRKQN
ncbi:MAG: hypothetical protein OXC46_01950 [Thaumarchaeota archaeon]|nr:hypothetical protein [Nitrososphaerota archaeon]